MLTNEEKLYTILVARLETEIIAYQTSLAHHLEQVEFIRSVIDGNRALLKDLEQEWRQAHENE